MESKAGLLILLVGPSGVGKNAVISQIVDQMSEFEFAPSSTTRPLRPGESQGEPYFFVTEAEFHRQWNTKEVLEYETVHGNYYWTARSKLQEIWNKGKSAITDVDVFGALRLIALLPYRVLTIYLTAPELVLRERIIQRHPSISAQELEQRMTRMRFEESLQTAFSARVVNVDVKNTADKCLGIVERKFREKPAPLEFYEFDEADILAAGLNCRGLCRFCRGRDSSLLSAASRQIRAIAYASHAAAIPQIRHFEGLPHRSVIETNEGHAYTVQRVSVVLE